MDIMFLHFYNYHRGLYVYLFSFFVLSSMTGQDSLLSLITNDVPDSTKVTWYIDIATLYADQLKSDSAQMYAQQAIKLAESRNLSLQTAQAYYTLGYVYDLTGELDQAIINYEESRKRHEILDIKEEVAHCLNSKGVAAYFKGDFDIALQHFTACLEYTELHNIETTMANTLNNIGIIYRINNKNRDAIAIYYKTLALSKRTSNQNMIATSYHNLGVAYNFESVLDTALIYFDSAAQHYTLVGNAFEVARVKIAIGEAYYLNGGNYGKARKALKEGEQYLLNLEQDQEVLSKMYLLIAQVERDDGNFQRAEIYFEKGLAIIENSERDDLKLSYFEELKEHHDLTQNTNKAYQALKKYINLYKEIQTNEKIKAIEELQTQYDTKEKEQKINLLNIENELNTTKLRARRQEISLLAIGSLFLLGLVLGLWRLYKKVKIQKGIIESALEEKDTLLREIHHRVKNNLQVISALLTLQSKHIKDELAIEALQEGQGRVQSMALIHQDLYQHDNLKGVKTTDYFEKLIENLIDTYNTTERNIQLECDIVPLMLDVDTMIPLGLVVNELTSNALKHAFEGKTSGNIKISLTEENGQLFLNVQDDGQGADPIQLESKSFGFSLIKSFARRLDAQLNIQNNDGLQVELVINNYQKAA